MAKRKREGEELTTEELIALAFENKIDKEELNELSIRIAKEKDGVKFLKFAIDNKNSDTLNFLATIESKYIYTTPFKCPKKLLNFKLLRLAFAFSSLAALLIFAYSLLFEGHIDSKKNGVRPKKGETVNTPYDSLSIIILPSAESFQTKDSLLTHTDNRDKKLIGKREKFRSESSNDLDDEFKKKSISFQRFLTGKSRSSNQKREVRLWSKELFGWQQYHWWSQPCP